MDIARILGDKFVLVPEDCGEFENFNLWSLFFNIESYDVNNGLAHLSIFKGKNKKGKTAFRALIITPKTKDMPIIVYRKYKFLFRDEFDIELYDSLIEKESYPSLKEINEKYDAVPTFKSGVSFNSHKLLKESIYKKSTKKSFVLSIRAFEEHLHEFGNLLIQKSNCDVQKKNEYNNAFIDEVLLQNTPFVQMFLKKYSPEDFKRFVKHILFGVE